MLTAEQVEQAFIVTARHQTGGPFNWVRLARLLNEIAADGRDKALGGRRLLEWPVQ